MSKKQTAILAMLGESPPPVAKSPWSRRGKAAADLLGDFEGSSADVEGSGPVPNQMPEHSPCNIAIIGEAPGKNEVEQLKPFVGYSGDLLWGALMRHNVTRSSVYVGNVSQHNPPANDITKFSWDGPEIQSGLAALRTEIAAVKPNIIIALGRTALCACAGERRSIDDWRGSLQWSKLFDCKYIATYHPAAVLRVYSLLTVFRQDINRAVAHSRSAALVLSERHVATSLDRTQILDELYRIRTKRLKVAVDIEGYPGDVKCVGFATSPTEAFVVPFTFGGRSLWDIETEAELLRAMSAVLEDVNVPKVLQNAQYDYFALAWTFGIRCRGIVDDTMLKHWELFPELEKSLAFQASIYTLQPYYKDGRDSTDKEAFLRYNGLDCCVTYECNEVMDKHLSASARRHYNFNVELLAPINYMQLRGIRFDSAEADRRSTSVENEILELRAKLNALTGRTVPAEQSARFELVRSTMLPKRGVYCIATMTEAELLAAAKAPFKSTILDAVRAARSEATPLTDAVLARACEVDLNIDSPAQLATELYTIRGYPPQYRKVRGRLTDSLSTDALSLLNIFKDGDELIATILALRAKTTALETLRARTNADGRIRCAYNLVGTETGRVASYASATGSGYNLQTVPKSQRPLFVADPDCELGEVDLSGADAWTVAAHCFRLGDPTMLEDLRYGVKPAVLLALMYTNGPEVARLPRSELLALAKTVSKDGWLYFANKCVQHGSNYRMRPPTIADLILKNSYKMNGVPIRVRIDVCERLQQFYFLRYPGVPQWHLTVERSLLAKPTITGASGHTRTFLGRRIDATTVKEALADEPQENTTYANNLALWRLWHDPENRREASLVVEPLHQIHDALLMQWQICNRELALAIIRRAFDNTITIARQPIKIPYEGHYGPAWNRWEGNI